MGYEDGGQLTERVRRRPWSVVLFDEIEKAHEDVWSILLQILDDGRLTDAMGRRADFRNALIVLTSNIGARAISEARAPLGFGSEPQGNEQMRRSVMEELRATFRPEFLNRVEETLVFRRLSGEDLDRITRKLLDEVRRRFEALGLGLAVSEEAVRFLARSGADAGLGARPLRRRVQHCLEDAAAELLLEGRASAGDELDALVSDGKLVLSVRH